MRWKDKDITVSDFDAIKEIKTREEAKEFLRLAKIESIYAESNIGYMLGYLSREEKHRLMDLFGVEHPVFGKEDPTPTEAINAGIYIAKHGYEAWCKLKNLKNKPIYPEWFIGLNN